MGVVGRRLQTIYYSIIIAFSHNNNQNILQKMLMISSDFMESKGYRTLAKIIKLIYSM